MLSTLVQLALQAISADILLRYLETRIRNKNRLVLTSLTIVITGVNTVTQLVTLGRPRPTGNGRVHDLSPAVTRQLVKT